MTVLAVDEVAREQIASHQRECNLWRGGTDHRLSAVEQDQRAMRDTMQDGINMLHEKLDDEVRRIYHHLWGATAALIVALAGATGALIMFLLSKVNFIVGNG